MDAETIRALIEAGLPGCSAQVHGPDGVHFEATVVCPDFAGKLPLARHRMVYATLGARAPMSPADALMSSADPMYWMLYEPDHGPFASVIPVAARHWA